MSKVLASWRGRAGVLAVAVGAWASWKWAMPIDTPSLTWLVPVFLIAYGVDCVLVAHEKP